MDKKYIINILASQSVWPLIFFFFNLFCLKIIYINDQHLKNQLSKSIEYQRKIIC